MREARAIGKARLKSDLASVMISETAGYVNCGCLLLFNWMSIFGLFSGCFMVLGRDKRS